MERYLGRFSPQAFAILRIVGGLMFMMHGTQKLLGWPGDKSGHMPLASLMGVAGIIEMVGGAMIAMGLFASFAAFICCGQMAVAYFTAHAPGGFFPIMNKGELAVLYCFLFLYIACHGAGIWSLDSLRAPRAKRA